MQAIAQWFNPRAVPQTSYKDSDFGESIYPTTMSVVGSRQRDTYVAHGPDDERTLKAIKRYISIAGTGKQLTKEQLEKQKAMGALITTYARGNFPAAHEFSLTITRAPLSTRYTIHHYDSNHRLIHEAILDIER